MDITDKVRAAVLASILNSAEVQDKLSDFGIELPFIVEDQDIMDVLNHKETINGAEVIAALKVVCAVAGFACPIINGL